MYFSQARIDLQKRKEEDAAKNMEQAIELSGQNSSVFSDYDDEEKDS